MNTLLIPTDFTAASVQLAAKAIRTINKKADIVFFHAFQLPFYYNDTLSSQPPYMELMNDRLRKACRQLKDQYPELVGSVSFRFMRGDTNALFRNFLEANNITMIVCPLDYQYKKVHADSINPVGFFKRSKLPLMQSFNAPERPVVLRERAINFEMVSAL